MNSRFFITGLLALTSVFAGADAIAGRTGPGKTGERGDAGSRWREPAAAAAAGATEAQATIHAANVRVLELIQRFGPAAKGGARKTPAPDTKRRGADARHVAMDQQRASDMDAETKMRNQRIVMQFEQLSQDVEDLERFDDEVKRLLAKLKTTGVHDDDARAWELFLEDVHLNAFTWRVEGRRLPENSAEWWAAKAAQYGTFELWFPENGYGDLADEYHERANEASGAATGAAVERTQEEQAMYNELTDGYTGALTRVGLKHRYRQLSKKYHPDKGAAGYQHFTVLQNVWAHIPD